MNLVRFTLAIILALLFPSSKSFGEFEYIFVADPGASVVFKIKLDGSGTLEYFLTGDSVPNMGAPEGVAVFEEINRIYWTEPSSNRIGEATLQGNFIAYHTVQTNGGMPTDININKTTKKLYWVEISPIFAIRRFSIPTMVEETYLEGSGQGGPQCIAIDTESNSVYYVDDIEDKVKKKRLQTTTTIFPTVTAPQHFDIEIDKSNNRVYWIEAGNFEIKYALLDGTSTTASSFAPNVYKTPRGIAIEEDGQKSKLYWSNTDGSIKVLGTAPGTSQAPYTLAGANEGLNSPKGLALSGALPLTPDTIITTPPEVIVNNATRQVTLMFEDFSTPILESTSLGATVAAAVSLSTKYVATIKETSTNVIRKVITKNTSATVKLPPGTYTANYKAVILSPLSTAKKETKRNTILAAIANLKKKAATVENGNKIRARRASLKLAGFKVKDESSVSPDTDPFTVE